jgi:UDP-2,3-diacylglucosamine pyrophosphatase LpxH
MKIKFAMLFLMVIFYAYPCFAGTSYADKTTSIPDTTSFNDPFTLDVKGIPSLNNERKLIVCISDLHLGADDSYTETKKNREPLVKFLDQIRLAPNIKELVIIGDLVDLWFVPSEAETFRGKTQKEFVGIVAKNNKLVMAAFNNIIRDGKIKVTYVPGNHDLIVTAEDIQNIFPGIHQQRDVQGLGSYSPDGHPEIVMEHGHRYNFFCAPDPISNRDIAPGSILPPGYFFTRIATTSVVEGHPNADGKIPVVTENSMGESQTLMYIYWKLWYELMTALPISDGFDEKIIKTNIDGFTDNYSISDFMPYQMSAGGYIDMKMYKGILDTWDERQALNQVSVKIPLKEALIKAASGAESDAQAELQYFKNPASDKRIVVFGHTHEPRIIPSENLKSQKTIYVNSGTWIDNNPNFPTMTFVVITPQGNSSVPLYLSLFYYSPDGTITKMDTQSL